MSLHTNYKKKQTSPPDAMFELKIHKKCIAAGVLPHTPWESLQCSPDAHLDWWRCVSGVWKSLAMGLYKQTVAKLSNLWRLDRKSNPNRYITKPPVDIQTKLHCYLSVAQGNTAHY